LDHLPQVGGGFGSSTTSWRRIWIVYHKSKEDLDCLLQAEGRLASIHQRALVPDDYSNFINDALPLSNGHQGLIAPPTWSGRPGHWKGTSPPRYPAQPTFLRLQLGRAGPGIGRARVLQATRLSPPFCASILVERARHWKGTSSPSHPAQPPSCASNLIERARALEGHESFKVPGSAHISAFFQLGQAGSGIGWAQSPPSYPMPAHFVCSTNPNNLSGLEPFQEGRILDSSMTTLPSRGHSVTCR
jgi:hypothetical protein